MQEIQERIPVACQPSLHRYRPLRVLLVLLALASAPLGWAAPPKLRAARTGEDTQRLVDVDGVPGAAGIAAHLRARAATFDNDVASADCASARFDQRREWQAGRWLAVLESRHTICAGRQYAEATQWLYNLDSGAAERIQDWLDERSWRAGRPVGTWRAALREAVKATDENGCLEYVDRLDWAEVRLSLQARGLVFDVPDWRPAGFCSGYWVSNRVLQAHVSAARRDELDAILAHWKR